jgi:hypothetical protein
MSVMALKNLPPNRKIAAHSYIIMRAGAHGVATPTVNGSAPLRSVFPPQRTGAIEPNPFPAGNFEIYTDFTCNCDLAHRCCA